MIAPDTLDTATLDSLFMALRDHFQPKPNMISKCFTFHRRNQLPTENITEYLVALRKLATDCNFGSKEALEETLRDRQVGGVRSVTTQKKLWSMKDLTFSVACGTARSLEAAEVNANEINHSVAEKGPTVHFVAAEHPRGPS